MRLHQLQRRHHPHRSGTINTSVSTLIGVPITDLTNGVHSVSALLSTGAGTLILSNANNTYSGGTTISAGVLQMGVNNALPSNPTGGGRDRQCHPGFERPQRHDHGLNGTGIVDTSVAGTPTLTVGANGNGGTFSGTIQNSIGTVSLTKIGAGTQTLSGGYTYSGATIVSGGTLNLNTASILPSTAGNVIVNSGGALVANVSGASRCRPTTWWSGQFDVESRSQQHGHWHQCHRGHHFPGQRHQHFHFRHDRRQSHLSSYQRGRWYFRAGNQHHAQPQRERFENRHLYPDQYTGASLGSIANFVLIPPPGVAATLVNNTGNDSIDVTITAIPNSLSWYGASGNNWDLTSVNWKNSGVDSLFSNIPTAASSPETPCCSTTP